MILFIKYSTSNIILLIAGYVNSQFKNNLCEKAKADTQTPNSRPGREIHYNRKSRFHARDGLFM